jgi:hypothetical protein
MGRPTPTDVLLVVTGPPFASDLTTTVLRLLDELLRRGSTVRVWTCGYAVMLTQLALGDAKPRDVEDWERRHPSTARLVAGLAAAFPEQLSWESCTFCNEDRGAGPHLDFVRLRAPSRLGSNMARARRTLYLGGA